MNSNYRLFFLLNGMTARTRYKHTYGSVQIHTINATFHYKGYNEIAKHYVNVNFIDLNIVILCTI